MRHSKGRKPAEASMIEIDGIVAKWKTIIQNFTTQGKCQSEEDPYFRSMSRSEELNN